MPKNSVFYFVSLTMFVVLSIPVMAQEPLVSVMPHEESAEPGCRSSKVSASTDRPTSSTSTDTTQCGVLEFVTGPERIWAGHGVHQDGMAPSVQFGLTPKLDLHYARATYFRLGNNPGPLSGQGDTFLGARYRFSKQSRLVPSFGTFYTLKVPTASVAKNLGTGRYDHQFMLIVSKDVARLHVDFDVMPNLVGRPDVPGFDKSTSLVLSGGVALPRHLNFSTSVLRSSALNADTPSFVSTSTGLLWQVRPRLILDVGMNEGLTTNAPRKRLCFGFTYAPANLYSLIAGPRERTR